MTTSGRDKVNDNVDRPEVGDYPLPLLSLIAQGLDPYGADLFIGGTAAASDVDLLRRHGISTVVNCTVNLDVNYVAGPDEGAANGDPSALCRSGTAPFRVFKVGLVDGENPRGMMLGGYYILHGALHQTLPEKQSYPMTGAGQRPRPLSRRPQPFRCLGGTLSSSAGPDSVPGTRRRHRRSEREARTASGRVVQGAETGTHRCRGSGGAGHPIAARQWGPCSLRTTL